MSAARLKLAESGDRSDKCMSDDERTAEIKMVIGRLFDPRKAKTADEAARVEALRERTIQAAIGKHAEKAVLAEVERIERERKEHFEARFGPQAKPQDFASALARVAESQEKQTAVLDALAKAITGGGKK